MTDLYLMVTIPVTVILVMLVINLVEYRDRCHHKWTKWDDPENTGVHVIQRRACEKCNLQESRVMIANATIEEKDEDVAVPPMPTDTVDQKAGA